MVWTLVITGLTLIVAACLGRPARGRTSRPNASLSVMQQHVHLIEGGRLSAAAIAAARRQLGGWLAAGRIDQVSAALRPGLEFAVNVAALAEIGGRRAAAVLRRHLHQAPQENSVEQEWYWLDLARGLRQADPRGCLPHLLSCPALARNGPLAPLFAAETAACDGFHDALAQPGMALGRRALAVLHTALRGVRRDLPLTALAEARLGEAAAIAWRYRIDPGDPLTVRVLVEAVRLAFRVEHIRFAASRPDRSNGALERQLEILSDLRAPATDFLSGAPRPLLAALARAGDDVRGDVLAALDDLRADAADVVIPRMDQWSAKDRAAAVRLLRWSPAARRWLCDHAWALLKNRRGTTRANALRWAEPGDWLFALRGSPTAEAERCLLAATDSRDAIVRIEALRSFGWWDPIDELAVHRTLQNARQDAAPEIALAAIGALARLGERQALQSCRAALAGDADAALPATLRWIADERLLWLWPDLDALADAADLHVAWAAREALELWREDTLGGVRMMQTERF
mgnify:CR=1 FL=1